MTVSDLCVQTHRVDPDRPRPALDGAYLCRSCRDQLTDHLARLPRLHHDLERVLAAGSTSGDRVSGSPSEPLPINPAAADHRHQITHDLLWWCIYVAGERGIARPAASNPATTATWLAVHLDWCAANRAAAEELLPVLRQLTGRASGLLDPDRHLATGERCRTLDDDGERCDGTISMRQRWDETWSAWCSACGAQEAAGYLHDGVAQRWVTIERVEAYVLRVHNVRVARSTIRSWAARERVQAKTERDRTWYELGSVNRYITKQKQERIGA